MYVFGFGRTRYNRKPWDLRLNTMDDYFDVPSQQVVTPTEWSNLYGGTHSSRDSNGATWSTNGNSRVWDIPHVYEDDEIALQVEDSNGTTGYFEWKAKYGCPIAKFVHMQSYNAAYNEYDYQYFHTDVNAAEQNANYPYNRFATDWYADANINKNSPPIRTGRYTGANPYPGNVCACEWIDENGDPWVPNNC